MLRASPVVAMTTMVGVTGTIGMVSPGYAGASIGQFASTGYWLQITTYSLLLLAALLGSSGPKLPVHTRARPVEARSLSGTRR